MIGISPLKTHGLRKESRVKSAREKLERSFETQKEIVAHAYAICWSRAEVARYFNVSEYMLRKARKHVTEKGILAIPDLKRGKTLSHEIEQSVIEFYEEDEFSGLMPGAKDFVSVGKKMHVQKRLLLCNLNELHVAYQKKNIQHTEYNFQNFAVYVPNGVSLCRHLVHTLYACAHVCDKVRG